MDMGASYLVYQEEMGEKGTHHLQGYVEFPVAARRTKISKVLDRAFIEIARGTPEENEKYCTKEGGLSEPIRFGKISKGSGARTDVLRLRDAVRDGRRGKDLYDDDLVAGAAIRYGRGVSDMASAYSTAPMREGVRVFFHFGPPGTGKTHCAHSEEAYYFDGNQGEFWIGYTGQSTLILDEFGGHVLKPLMLQRLCDKYPLWLAIKGGQVPCNVCFLSLEPVFFANVFNRLSPFISAPIISRVTGGVRRPGTTKMRYSVVL